jgi:hypothetical protein
MSSDYDATEFIDGDLQQPSKPSPAAATTTAAAVHSQNAPTREEVDSRVSEAQQKLADLKRAQEELERQRAALEETRRRQTEFQTGRQEMLQNLTRGLGLLEEAEFNSRSEAEQMARVIVDFREALAKVQTIHEESWTRDNFGVELTRALTTLENARMEWNAARLKFPVLSGVVAETSGGPAPAGAAAQSLFGTRSFGELCRIGFALTWPVAAVLLFLGVIIIALLRH